jgi:hypothetical protein
MSVWGSGRSKSCADELSKEAITLGPNSQSMRLQRHEARTSNTVNMNLREDTTWLSKIMIDSMRTSLIRRDWGSVSWNVASPTQERRMVWVRPAESWASCMCRNPPQGPKCVTSNTGYEMSTNCGHSHCSLMHGGSSRQHRWRRHVQHCVTPLATTDIYVSGEKCLQ